MVANHSLEFLLLIQDNRWLIKLKGGNVKFDLVGCAGLSCTLRAITASIIPATGG